MRLNEITLSEAGYPEVDHMPGPVLRGKDSPLSKGCTTCHGRKAVYKLPDGSTRADNVKGAKRIACPACKGTGTLSEAGMPASIIKAKQAYAMKTPEELYKMFLEIAERTGKSVEELAVNAARRHGYKNPNTYWHRIGGGE